MVFSMCRIAISEMQAGNKQVIETAREIAGELNNSKWVPATPQELTNRIFCTCYVSCLSEFHLLRGP